MSDQRGNDRDWRNDVLDMLYAVARRRILIATILAVFIGLGYGAANTSDPFFTASGTFVLLPREKPIIDLSVQSSSVETAEDAAKRSDAATLTLPPNPDLYTTLIRSGDAAQRVVGVLKSDDSLAGKALPTVGELRSGTSVESTEEGVIKVSVTAYDPYVAAAAANALVVECENASKAIERQLIVQQSGFLGSAIVRAETRLDEARARLSQFSMRFGVADPSVAAACSASLIKTLDESEARISRELERLLVHRTEADPQVAALRAELNQVFAKRDSVRASYCGDLSESEFSTIESEWRALKQDVTLRQDLLMSMRARHDVFSIRADQPAGNLAVIRPAGVPAAPSGPSKRKYLVLATLLGVLLSGVACVTLDQLEQIHADERAERRLASILHCFSFTHRTKRTEVMS